MNFASIHIPLFALAIALPVGAQAAEEQDSQRPAQGASSESTAPLAHGEVKKIDKDTGKVTLKHGPLENLGMPAMTMVFRVKDPAMLDQLKAGDRIKFLADRWKGALTVMRFEMEQ